MGYFRAGFEVVGVDIVPQPNYPFSFFQDDAMHVLRALAALGHYQYLTFDAIHASPPCQASIRGLGAVNRALGREYAHEDLIPRVRDKLTQIGRPYVIENVVGAELLNPIQLCGSSFGLPVQRHRLFETNWPLMAAPCAHHLQTEPKYWTGWRPNGATRLAKVVQVYGNAGGRDEWPAAMDIGWMTSDELIEAIPPAYTEHVGGYLLSAVANAPGNKPAPTEGRGGSAGHWLSPVRNDTGCAG
jgi:DNA (cytosine-5)-methyltransferase 1